MKTRIRPAENSLRHSKALIEDALSGCPEAYRKHLELSREHVGRAILEIEMVMVKSREVEPPASDE